MSKIEVMKKEVERFEVIVHERTITKHTVNLTEDYYQQLTEGKVSPEMLIEKSFEFLLER